MDNEEKSSVNPRKITVLYMNSNYMCPKEKAIRVGLPLSVHPFVHRRYVKYTSGVGGEIRRPQTGKL